MYRIYLARRDGRYDSVARLTGITTTEGTINAEFSLIKDPVEFDDCNVAVSLARLIMSTSDKVLDVVKVKEVTKVDFEKIW